MTNAPNFNPWAFPLSKKKREAREKASVSASRVSPRTPLILALCGALKLCVTDGVTSKRAILGTLGDL